MNYFNNNNNNKKTALIRTSRRIIHIYYISIEKSIIHIIIMYICSLNMHFLFLFCCLIHFYFLLIFFLVMFESKRAKNKYKTRGVVLFNGNYYYYYYYNLFASKYFFRSRLPRARLKPFQQIILTYITYFVNIIIIILL